VRSLASPVESEADITQTPRNTTQRGGNNAGGNAQRYASLGHTSVRWPTLRNDENSAWSAISGEAAGDVVAQMCSVPFRQLL
jgi:hypothetical protein